VNPPCTFRVASLVACALLLGSDALRANDALDFWRQEWSRQRGRVDQPVERSPFDPGLRLTVRPKRERAEHAGYAGERHYCVRTCDGFYFPLSGQGGSSKAEMCRALCPAAATEVYRLGAGAETIESAVSERGRPYASLPAALAYRKSLRPSCSCRGSTATAMAVPIANDPTLVRGDVVVTHKGVRIFAGGAKLPFRDSDFVHYRNYRGLSREVITMLSLIDRPFQASELKQTLELGREPAGTGGLKTVRAPGSDSL
jgi:uncharacterized protein DUF2865